MRAVRGDGQLGNHLCLIVHGERDWLVDGGFGGSLSAPLPLAVGERRDGPYRVGLTRAEDGYWRYWETEGEENEAFSFDFRAEPADEALLAAKCHELQTDPESMFIQNLVVQRRFGDAHLSLRGRVLVRTGEAEKRMLASPDELVAMLRDPFGLELPEAASLWPAICARHEVVMAANPASA
jgi:N-hydroxyarylamine O-acetyltransferase